VSELGDSLRVSDAERDVTLKTLNDNAAVGRLTLDELEERAGYRLPPQARGVSLKEARRLAKAAERGQLPPGDR
jgi:hypothetical protein